MMLNYTKIILLLILGLFYQNNISAQEYPNIVTVVSQTGTTATFNTVGASKKKQAASVNAIKSLFNTLLYVGVDGFNDGKPLVITDNKEYTTNFINNRYSFYVSSQKELGKPAKNSSGNFQVTLQITVPIASLYKELERNKIRQEKVDKSELTDVDVMDNIVLPTIIVVPYKKDGESYDAILQSDYDRRIAVAKIQAGFESRDISTVDLSAKIAAMKRRSEYEAGTADSNDKNLLMSSGADVYVVVDMLKDIQPHGSRVSLIMKAYETSSGTILASKDGFTNRYKTSAVDILCSYAVKDNLEPFLNDIAKNFNKQVNTSKRVVLQISIAGSSMMTMSDVAGKSNYSISNVIRQWVRKNASQGKYHLQGVVSESMIFDYVMIPPKDEDGFMMDAAQFGFLLQSYLTEDEGIQCSSKIDGNTIYITIE